MPRKRANGEGSIRKRENGTWEARIQLGNDPVTGKPIRKSVYAKTQKEARNKLQELIEKKKSQSYNQVEDDKLTLDTWLDMWLNSYLVDASLAFSLKPDACVSANGSQPRFRVWLLPCYDDSISKTFVI